MKVLASFAVLALLTGCATTENTQLASADCKVMPITTTSITGVRKTAPTSLEQREAQAHLAGSDYRMRNLARNGLAMNNVEDALRDCNNAR